MRDGLTRRGFLGTGAAGIAGAAAAAPGLAAVAAPADAAGTVPGGAGSGSPHHQLEPFYGRHQAGITTRSQNFMHFLALDLVTGSPDAPRALMRRLSAASERLARGLPVGGTASDPGSSRPRPPLDTGEARGLPAARLTITFGLGPAMFAAGRFGLEAQRPAPLVEIPPLANDALDPALCGGDIAVQACAEDPQVAFHAIHDLIRAARPDAVPRWSLAGFGRTLNTREQPTPRNLFGFKEGTGNLKAGEPGLDRYVWAALPESPAWMTDGTYMVVRRIEFLLDQWDSIGLDQQERTFGRHKLSGAPLGRRREYDPLDLQAAAGGRPIISPFAHVRLASPEYNQGERLLRRGYSYAGPATGAAEPAAGQLFICFQRDPRRQFIPIARRLAVADLLNEHTVPIGSAIFACPPGAQPGGYVGQTLLG